MDDADLGAAMGQYAAEQKVERLEKRVEKLERQVSALLVLLHPKPDVGGMPYV